MTRLRSASPVDGQSDHGANLVFRAEPVGPPEVMKLPKIGVGLECPGFLHAQGPVTVDGRTVQVEIYYQLEMGARFPDRYKVIRLTVATTEPGDEVDADVMRRIRWAQMVAPGLDTSARVVVYGDDGVEERHRSLATLTADQQTAALWLRAQVGGIDPNKHIAESLGISRAAAAARVKRLRDHKAIPEATQGQRR